MILHTPSTVVFACHAASCRPPKSGGTGGSVRGGALPNGANPDRHAKQIITEMNAPNGVLGVVPEHAGMIKEAATILWGRVMPSDPVVRVRVPDDEDVLRSILRDGRFKSQHESGESMGYFNPATREFHEHQMFRVKGSRPIYGYLAERALSGKMPTSNPLSAYGSIAFELKPGVLQRSTITMGDSLNTGAAPIRVGDVKTATPERLMAATGSGIRDHIGSMVTRDKMNPKEVGNNLADWGWHEYVETQVHGGVSLSDVARVIIRGSRTDTINLIRSLAPDLEIVTIGENETFSARTLVAACHAASCRPPKSGGTGGSVKKGGLPNGADPEPYAQQLLQNGWGEDRSAAAKYMWDTLYPSDPVVRIRVPESAIRGILSDGRLVTQRESGSSEGLFAPEFRDRVEKRMFSADNTDPIYGYVTGASGSPFAEWVNAYGHIAFELSPSAAVRTTVSLGDSLYGLTAPLRVTDVPSAGAERLHAATVDAIRRVIDNRVANSDAQSSLIRAVEGHALYFEAQVHGGVSMKDVSRVLVRGDRVRPETVEALRAALPHAEVVVVTDANVEFSTPSGSNYDVSMAASHSSIDSRIQDLYATAILEEFECKAKTCAPPPVGIGGSLPRGGSTRSYRAKAFLKRHTRSMRKAVKDKILAGIDEMIPQNRI